MAATNQERTSYCTEGNINSLRLNDTGKKEFLRLLILFHIEMSKQLKLLEILILIKTIKLLNIFIMYISKQ